MTIFYTNRKLFDIVVTFYFLEIPFGSLKIYSYLKIYLLQISQGEY